MASFGSDPLQAFLLAYGSGLMGTRGGGGFGRAGLMGLDAMNTTKRTQLLENEESRRSEDSKISRQMHDLQMKQMQLAIEDDARNRQVWAGIAERFKGRQPQAPVPQMPAGPLNPDMSPVDAAMLSRNHMQAQQQQAASPAGPFPFSYEDVMAAKYATRGKIDLTGDYKDALKTEEIKPGTWQRGVDGRMTFVDAFDVERGVQGNPNEGLRPIAGAQQAKAGMAGAVKAAEAAAEAEWQPEKVLDKTPGSPTEGQLIPVPRARVPGFGPQRPVPEPVAQPPQPVESIRPGPPPPPQPQRQAPAAAVNGAPANNAPPTNNPPATPGGVYRTAQDRLKILADERAKEVATPSPAQATNLAALDREIALAQQQLSQMGRGAPAAAQTGPQGVPAQAPVGSPQPRPAAPTGPVYVSPEQAERDAQRNKSQNRVAQSRTTTDTVKANIDEALSFIGLTSTGAIGAAARWAPWPTDAGRLENAVRSVQSALSFDTLQTMRENSPTGGAVGNASDRDIKMLETTIVTLDPVRDGPDLTRKKLLRVKQHYEHWLQLREDAHQNQFGISAPPLDLTPRDRQVPTPSGFKYLGVQGG